MLIALSSITNYMGLISYASRHFVLSPGSDHATNTWIHDFSRLVLSLNTTSQETTSVLALLSASVANGNPLPPYVKAPSSYKLSERLQALDADILGISHIAEPGYSAFAVMQIASSLINDDMEKLIGNVKDLVGEVDFSFHIVSTAASSDDTLVDKEVLKGKKD